MVDNSLAAHSLGADHRRFSGKLAALNERAFRFGDQNHLFGILSLPEKLDTTRPVILIPNTGFEHRVGPNRLHVHLCRAFAELGFAALRLDLAGNGDSELPPRMGQCDASADLRAALDALELGNLCRGAVVIGLCSGGNDVHHFARLDRRVVAAAFIDHFVYPTAKFYRIFLAQRLLQPTRILNLFRLLAERFTGEEKDRFNADEVEYFAQPTLEQFDADVAGFVARGMPLYFAYSGEYQNIYNYRDQLFDACPRLRQHAATTLHHFPGCDHTFSLVQMRVELISSLRLWLIGQVLPSVPGRDSATVYQLPVSA